MIKKELRKEYGLKRLALTPQQTLRFDDLMLIHFQRLDFGLDVSILMSYFAMHHRNEIDPYLFSNFMQLGLPHLKVAYPKVEVSNCSMQAYLVAETADTAPNAYGIEEPVDGQLITATDVDVIFVPLLAFDKQGYRVGYGKGYYDRYLSCCRDDAVSVGFSYFEPVDKIEDTNQFDIPLNYCITPQQLYEF